MAFNPLAATGLVISHPNQSREEFCGTCFLFRSSAHALTAAHVIAGRSVADLALLFPHALPIQPHMVRTVHPVGSADLVVLELSTSSVADPFWGWVSDFTIGEDFMAYGYPEDVLGPTPGQPTPRLFRGHYQRYMYHHSHLPYEYNAGEMSVAAPEGLSGGPVFRPGDQRMITGVVTENLSSRTVLAEFVEERAPDYTVRTEHQRIIQYGVALLLDSWASEINKHVPQRSADDV